jgi:thermostable 8-oxoguanine DNA glycosylase
MDIKSRADCRTLIRRIHETLEVERPELTTRIDRIAKEPSHLLDNDARIFEKLSIAILAGNTTYDDLKDNLPEIGRAFLDWDIEEIARLSNPAINGLYRDKIGQLNICTGDTPEKTESKLRWIRDDAHVFRNIQERHGSVWEFIGGLFSTEGQEALIQSFAYGSGKYPIKLRGVGLATCCEFLKGIGFDEFKPDRHAIRFFRRIRLMENSGGMSGTDERARAIGITIANNIASEEILQPRKYVDALVWNLCAAKRGQICAKYAAKKLQCRLYTDTPRLCECPSWIT